MYTNLTFSDEEKDEEGKDDDTEVVSTVAAVTYTNPNMYDTYDDDTGVALTEAGEGGAAADVPETPKDTAASTKKEDKKDQSLPLQAAISNFSRRLFGSLFGAKAANDKEPKVINAVMDAPLYFPDVSNEPDAVMDAVPHVSEEEDKEEEEPVFCTLSPQRQAELAQFSTLSTLKADDAIALTTHLMTARATEDDDKVLGPNVFCCATAVMKDDVLEMIQHSLEKRRTTIRRVLNDDAVLHVAQSQLCSYHRTPAIINATLAAPQGCPQCKSEVASYNAARVVMEDLEPLVHPDADLCTLHTDPTDVLNTIYGIAPCEACSVYAFANREWDEHLTARFLSIFAFLEEPTPQTWDAIVPAKIDL